MAETISKSVNVDMGGIDLVQMVKSISAMEQGIEYLTRTMDEIKEWKKGQEDIIRLLQQNCNREERWKNTTTKVEDLEVRIVQIERGKCPKLPVLENHEGRIESLETVKIKTEGSQETQRSNLEYTLAGFAIVEGLIIVWQFIGSPT